MWPSSAAAEEGARAAANKWAAAAGAGAGERDRIETMAGSRTRLGRTSLFKITYYKKDLKLQTFIETLSNVTECALKSYIVYYIRNSEKEK